MRFPEGITDIHVHIEPWEQLHPQVRAAMLAGRADLEAVERFALDPCAFAAYLERCGIERAGIINYPAPQIMGFTPAANDFVAAYRDARPDRFIAWGGMDVKSSPDPAGEMRRLLDELRLDGIKVHPPHQGHAANAYLDGMNGLRTLYSACQERGVPVMVHTGTSVFPGARSRFGDPMACDDVAVDFPALRLVLAHAGRPLWYEHAFFLARRHPNVYLDLSGIPPQQLPQRLPRLEQIADRVLWGSDWPGPRIRDPRTNLEVFLGIPEWTQEFKHKVLVDNALQLFPRREGKPG